MDAPSDAVVEPLTATVRYRDAFGHMQEIRVTSTLAREIRNVRQRARRADERWRERHRPMTDLELEAEAIASQDRPRVPASDASPWEGPPKIQFLLLLGLSLQWPVPPPGKGRGRRPCPGCHDRPLSPIAACLICLATGMDHMITPPTRAELKLKRGRRPRGEDGLAGGVGPPKAKPKASPPPPGPAPGPKGKAKKPKPPKPKPQWVQEYERLRGAAKDTR